MNSFSTLIRIIKFTKRVRFQISNVENLSC